MSKLLKTLVFISLFGILAYQAIRYQSDLYFGFYRQAMFGDKAGYYAYLPFFTLYGGNASALPDSIVEKTGLGFSIENNKLISKYPVGIAMMQAPFFAMGYAVQQIRKQPQQYHGFDKTFSNFIVSSAAFYVALGLWLLFESLRILTNRNGISAIITALVIFGSSLFYYTVIEGMMSHAYSFCLFAGLIYLWLKITSTQELKKLLFAALACCTAMIILVRPFNLLMIPFVIAGATMAHNVPLYIVWPRIKTFILWFVPTFTLLALPQLLYYKYAYGSWLADSYAGETFNFYSPNIMPMFFGMSYGLLVYVPLFALLFLATLAMAWHNKSRFILFPLTIILFSYILSSWHSWSFGCGFGIRPFVEWLPFLAIPLAVLLQKLSGNKFNFILGLMLPIIMYNVRMTYKWTGCWFGTENTFAEYLNWFW